ncbi:MAG TPA: hypothetical protein VLA82_10050 [Actinomycetota bacterium]|nr:hypothetical protein [Actinomycetota bacterium]
MKPVLEMSSGPDVSFGSSRDTASAALGISIATDTIVTIVRRTSLASPIG